MLASTIARAHAFKALHEAGLSIAQIAEQEGYSKCYTQKLISEVTPPLTSSDPLYWQRAVKVASEVVGADREKFLGADKSPKRLIHARWAVMAGMRKRGASLHQVANRLNRDHTTVIYALRQIEHLAARNPDVAQLVALVDAA